MRPFAAPMTGSGGFARPQRIREATPLVAEIGPAGHVLELPVDADERAEIGLVADGSSLLQHPHVPCAGIDRLLSGEGEGTIAERVRRSFEAGHG